MLETGCLDVASESTNVSLDKFISTWAETELTEQQGSHSHFEQLCQLFGVPTPSEVDQTGSTYCFEKGVLKSTGKEGWADVWKKGSFAWEYKSPNKDLGLAFQQLQQYVHALENPPILVTCDLRRFEIITNWTNTVSKKYSFSVADLREPLNFSVLKAVFSDPERLRPGQTRKKLAEDIAGEFAELAHKLRGRTLADGSKPASLEVAHFIIRLMFCMFAEDAELLPRGIFKDLLKSLKANPSESAAALSDLFAQMRRGGRFGPHRLAHFNGGLFGHSEDVSDSADFAFGLERSELDICIKASQEDWSEIDPSILGTLFVRGLDPEKRGELGAEYTDYATIKRIVDPVLVRPLLNEWSAACHGLQSLIEPARAALTAALEAARDVPELQEEVRQVRERVGIKTQMDLFENITRQRRTTSLDRVRYSLRSSALDVEKALLDARKPSMFLLLAFDRCVF